MENQCQGNTCDTQKTAHEAKSQDCCPLEMMIEKWSDAFCEAKHQVQVEILKEKIRKAWGAQMEKSADAIIEAKGAEWHAMLTKGKAKMELKDRLKQILNEGKK